MTAAPEPTPRSRRASRLQGRTIFLAVAVVYAAVAITWTWPLARQATTHTAMQSPSEDLALNDQTAVVSLAARNAAAILDGDLQRLINQNICHPMPRSATFGEHGIEIGILSLPVYALTRNPILSFNSGILLLVVISGVGMFALVRHLTGSGAAGFVAGALFAFDPVRLGDLAHPHVVGLHWIPPALLMFERLLASGRARDAVLLALFAALQTLVGSYPLVVFTAFAAAYGAVRLVQLRGAIDRRRVVGLALAVGFAVCVAALVLAPYAITGASWGTLRAKKMYLIMFEWLLPGAHHAIGASALLLALPLVLLRARRPTPVPAVLLGTVVCTALASHGVLWPGGPFLGGLYPWLASQVWLLGAVRVPAAIGHGIHLGFAILAGLGMARALDRWQLGRAGRAAVLAVASALVFVTIFQPDISLRLYRSTQRVDLTLRAPGPGVLAAYEAFDDGGHPGPIVELPLTASRGVLWENPRYVLMAAYHQRPTAACFKSHVPPTYYNMARIVGRLHLNAAIDELAASGFRNLVVYHNVLAKMPDVLEVMRRRDGVEVLYESDTVSSFRIDREVAVHSDPAALRLLSVTRRRTFVKAGVREFLDFEVANRARPVWVLPRPVEPTIARFRWWKNGIAGAWSERRFLMPIALAGGSRDLVSIEIGRSPRGCPCRIEAEIPALGLRLNPSQIKHNPAVIGDDF